ncbi:MAG: homoserine dehydrogenase [bacterium]
MRKINIGMIGCGTVGEGVIKLLKKNKSFIEKLGFDIEVKRIVVRNINKPRDEHVDESLLTDRIEEIIDDESIEIVVEVMGGYQPALDYVMESLRRRKNVITANKAMLARYSEEIFGLADEMGVDVYFEASVCGGIPVIKALREGLIANDIDLIMGIVNGTTNYILTKMTKEKSEFQKALGEAQAAGYAEADPTFDVEGLDSAHKIAILASIAYGVKVTMDDVHTEGIDQITPQELEYASQLGYTVKLLAIAKRVGNAIDVRVHPTMIPKGSLLSDIDGAYNAIYIVGDSVGPTMFYGQGAGQMPTASAVVADIIDVSRNIASRSTGRMTPVVKGRAKLVNMDDVVLRYYVRCNVVDEPGVLAQIAGIFGRHNISISSVIQPEARNPGGKVPILIMTHEAKESSMRQAIEEIDELAVVLGKSVLIRVEE